jgi:hypothetical protein
MPLAVNVMPGGESEGKLEAEQQQGGGSEHFEQWRVLRIQPGVLPMEVRVASDNRVGALASAGNSARPWALHAPDSPAGTPERASPQPTRSTPG